MAASNALIWRLIFPDQKVSYLYGTIHLDSRYFKDNRDRIIQLMRQCTAFSAEVNLKSLQDHDPQFFFKLKGNSQWETLVKSNQIKKMRAIAKDHFKLDLDAYFNFYPLMLVHLLSLELSGASGEEALDMQLWKLANEFGMDCTGLEDMEYHFSIIGRIPLKDQIKMLKLLMYNRVATANSLKVLRKKYEAGDIRAVYLKSKRMLGVHRRLMLYERNEYMANEMYLQGTSKSHFFCCGAAHLYGAFGILRNLKKRSIRIEPVHF